MGSAVRPSLVITSPRTMRSMDFLVHWLLRTRITASKSTMFRLNPLAGEFCAD